MWRIVEARLSGIDPRRIDPHSVCTCDICVERIADVDRTLSGHIEFRKRPFERDRARFGIDPGTWVRKDTDVEGICNVECVEFLRLRRSSTVRDEADWPTLTSMLEGALCPGAKLDGSRILDLEILLCERR